MTLQWRINRPLVKILPTFRLPFLRAAYLKSTQHSTNQNRGSNTRIDFLYGFFFCNVFAFNFGVATCDDGYNISETKLDYCVWWAIAAMMASGYNAKEEDGHHSGAPGNGGAGAVKSKKPDNTAFKQQRLPAWQPILTAGTVLPAFFVIGLIFIPIGIGLFVTSNNIKEFEVMMAACSCAVKQ